MMIDLDLLLAWGGTYKKYNAGEFVFNEGANCTCYNQLVEGQVKWVNYNDEGKEFIQTLIEPGECFGEIPLFDDEPYVASAVALEESMVIKLPRNLFLQLVKENSDISFKFCQLLANRLRYKFMLLKTNAFENPENRITALLTYYKKKKCLQTSDAFKVNLTRQQIANMTGLRVETVIRTIRHLNEIGSLDIVNGKVFI
jgi:CRP-like cAMP-binding protein